MARFNLATARPGGVYAPLGKSLCHLYNRARPSALPACHARLSGGSVDNIARLRRGEAAVAIVQADVLHWAWTGAGPFADRQPYRDLAVLFPAHDEIATVLVGGGTGIAGVADLVGKRLAVSLKASGSHATLDALLGAFGWTPADFASFDILTVDAQVDALCAGQIDAAAFVVGHPSGHVQRAIYDCGARLLPLDGPDISAATDTLPFLRPSAIPAGSYRGQDEAVPAPGLTALVVARASWPVENARAFVAAVSGQDAILRRLHPAFGDIDLSRESRAAEEVGMHAGVAP